MSATDPAGLASFGWFLRAGRLRIDATGPDRAKCLNNLSTNDIRRLPPGLGCEAFITNPQGKTLGFVTILAAEDRLILRSEVEARDLVLPHFQKYAAFDDVAFEDVSDSTFEIVVTGTDASSRLDLPAEIGPLGHRMGSIAGKSVVLVRDDPTGRGGWTILGNRDDFSSIVEALKEFGPEIEPGSFDAMRIEAGTPAFGREVTAENLPQEIGRDATAINFVKGCYLGQETVARIDALGHVNKILRGLKINGNAVPEPGSALEKDGKAVGRITSSAFSENLGCPVALAVIRVAAATAGTRVDVVTVEGTLAATVCELPMVPIS